LLCKLYSFISFSGFVSFPGSNRMAAAAGSATIGTITLLVDGNEQRYKIMKELEGGTRPLLVSHIPNTESTTSNTTPAQFVLKLSGKKGGAQEANEYLAFQLYKAAGCRVPETYLVKDKATGLYGLLEEFIEGATLRELMDKRDSEINALIFPAIQRDLVIHALLANWDINVMGNTMIPFKDDGNTLDYENPVTLDCGGTLQFRAMGEFKPYKPYVVGEALNATNIHSIVRYARDFTPMGKLQSKSEAERKEIICNRWKAVDNDKILRTLAEVESKFATVEASTMNVLKRAGLDFSVIRAGLKGRMAYLDTYCGKASTTANAGGAGAGAGATSAATSAATTEGGGRRKRSKTYKRRRQLKKRKSQRRRRAL
jgi:hypothetical protein